MTVMTLALTAVCACSMSSRGGGMSKDEGFKISVPTFSTNVKQGEVQNVGVSLHRGDYFKQDVRLEFKTTEGISVDPTGALIKASDKPDLQLRIAANKDAALGDYRVYVKGTPETGQPTSVEFTVTVAAP